MSTYPMMRIVQDTEAQLQLDKLDSHQQIKLASGEGSKTVYFKVRDECLNQSGAGFGKHNPRYDEAIVTYIRLGRSKISKVSGKMSLPSLSPLTPSFDEFKVQGRQLYRSRPQLRNSDSYDWWCQRI